jgi:hypothetical protein
VEALILSYALDTNGQNYRYVQAAKKHGGDVLRALAIGHSDPAGVVGRFKVAADKGDDLRIRSVSASKYEYLQFPIDIFWDKQRRGNSEQMIKELIMAADVIHLNNSEMAYKHFRIRKPALLHHHGSLFRDGPERMLEKAKYYRMEQAVSTIDLLRFAPDLLTWLPSAYDVDYFQAYAKEHARQPDGRVLIVHCPTDRAKKHTAVLLAAVDQLKAEGLPVDLELIEFRPWTESLAAKARADIVFDQLMWGYGCNGIEAWAMGKPVIAGADEWTLNEMTRQWGGLPFLEANQQSLTARLRKLVTSPDLRAQWAEYGLAHVRKYHDEAPALAILAELYQKAIQRYTRQRIPGKAPAGPATFRQDGARKVYDPETGEPIPFKDGQIVTDDPYVIDRLRHLARRRAFGIEEVA